MTYTVPASVHQLLDPQKVEAIRVMLHNRGYSSMADYVSDRLLQAAYLDKSQMDEEDYFDEIAELYNCALFPQACKAIEHVFDINMEEIAHFYGIDHVYII